MSGHLEVLPRDTDGRSLLPHQLLAIQVTQPFTYDDQAGSVPPSFKGKTPTALKTHGTFVIPKGEECFKVVVPNPDPNWAIIVVIRQDQCVYAVIPHTYYEIGSPEPGSAQPGIYFRALDEKLSRNQSSALHSYHPIGPAGPANPQGFFQRWMHEYWRLVSQNLRELTDLGMNRRVAEALHSNTHRAGLEAMVMTGLPAQVLVILDRGPNMTRTDILDLPRITQQYPRSGGGIYVRLYTHTDDMGQDINVTTIYIGQSVNVQHRQNQHEQNTPSGYVPPGTAVHYRLAQKASEEHRHAMILCFWPSEELGTLPPWGLDFAEQTMITYLRAFNYSMTVNASAENRSHYSGQSNAMFRLANQAFDNLGGGRTPIHKGANVSSPIFSVGIPAEIKMVPLRPFNERGKNVYRIPASGGKESISMGFRGASVHALPKNGSAYIRFEVMTDYKPHDTPWAGFPSVGPFQSFGFPSCMSAHVKYTLDGIQWFEQPLQRVLNSWETAVQRNSQAEALKTWRLAFNIIQALEGIVLTGEHDDTFSTRVHFNSQKVIVLEVNHLEQTARWAPQTEKRMSAPGRVSINQNFIELWRKYNNVPMMVIGWRPPRQLHPVSSADNLYWQGQRDRVMCDICRIDPADSYPNSCIPADSGLASCTRCILLNRPCTFTPISVLREQLGTADPAWKTGISRTSTLPFKDYSFYLTIPRETCSTPVPIAAPIGGSHILLSAITNTEDVSNDDGEVIET